MKWSISSVAILVVAVWSVAAGAQPAAPIAKGDKMDKMDKMEMMDMNYIGCVETGSAADSFTLTHLAADDHMGKDMMKKDVMKKGTMAKDGMNKDGMVPTALTLMGSSVDLSKHRGHKVSVTGSLAHEKMDAMDKSTMGKATSAFTVKSLKMVAATCS